MKLILKKDQEHQTFTMATKYNLFTVNKWIFKTLEIIKLCNDVKIAHV